MGKSKLRIHIITVIALICFALTALGIAWLPLRAFADTAYDAASAQKSHNENLIVKYSLDDSAIGNGAKLKAQKWDSAAQAFVDNPSADATVQNHVNNDWVGTLSSVIGVEGSSALSFTAKAHARADFHLPAGATGMTVSMWLKNSNTYWGSLVEFWDGANGGRFGKGTMQRNGGRANEADPWDGNCAAHKFSESAQGGGWDSFVTEINSNDNGGANVDLMQKEVWYQVTYVVTGTEMRAYRDGVLKQTFKDGVQTPTAWGDYKPSDVLTSIMNAAKSENGKLGIRLGHDSTKEKADILDDFRIYNGAMSADEVQSLYGEYNDIKTLHGNTVHLDGIDKEYTIDNSNNIRVTTPAAEFPKILIGGVTADGVTLSDGVYSASGNGFAYTYTVGEYAGDERVATVTYTDAITKNVRIFTVTQINKKTIKLLSLQVKVDGELRDIEGFDSEYTEYQMTLSPFNYSVEFVVTVSDGGSSDVETVNANIVFNGENVITTSGDGDSVSYKVTLNRERADIALPVLSGVQLGLATQNIYVDELPSSVAANSIVLAYPNSSEVQDFSYNTTTHTVTFKIADKASGDKTTYTVVYKTKQEGHVAMWSFEESVGTLKNRTFRGKRWDATTNAYVEDAALDMTVRSGSYNAAVTDNRTAAAATPVTGVLGKGIELAAWGYTTASIPAVADGTTGFTFSTWMKLNHPDKPWEAVFAVLGSEYGTILEKGNMQKHTIVSGQPRNGWDNLYNSTGNWTDLSLDSDAKKASYFNTPSNGASYVFYTVSVTYANGVGVIKFYKDGELAVVFQNDAGATDKAKVIIDAMNAGAKVGLHRHHLDSEYASRYDETNIYAYAQTDTEIKAAYDSVAALLAVSPEYYNVEGLGYPDLLLGGATSVSGSGTKTGVTSSGVTYSYTPLTVAATPANDEKGVEVTFNKDGNIRVTTVKFRRTLTILPASLGYKIGDGANVPIEPPQTAGEDIIVKVAADTDLTDVRAGDIAAQPFPKDSDTSHYSSQFSYSAKTQTATVRLSYSVYTGYDTLYTIKFVKKSTDTFYTMSVTGGKTDLELTKADFTENSVNVVVNDLTDFTLNVAIEAGSGAQLSGGGNTQTFTQSDLTGGKLAVTVINENGDSTVYYLVPVTVSSDATLSAMSAGEYGLNFAAGQTEYSVTVNKGEGANLFTALNATATGNGATVQKIYDKTDNKIIITVTASDGVSVQKYFIEVNELDTDATLSEIKVGGTAVAGFDPEKSNYTVKYAGELPSVTAAAASATAQEPSIGAADADGKVVITVTAESGATKEYTVTLVKKSSDAALKKLTLNGTEITFEGNTAEYQAPMGTRISKIIVVAETADGASSAYKVSESENKLTVTVTAEDGTTATYTVAVSISSGDLIASGETIDNTPPLNSSLSGGAIAGIVIGAVAAAAALSVGAWFVVTKLRKAR